VTTLMDTGRPVNLALVGQVASVNRAASLLPDFQQLVIPTSDGTLRVFSWANSAPDREIPVFGKGTWIWCTRRHGNRLAVGRLDQRMISDFDLSTWELKDTWPSHQTQPMDFTADGRFCVMVAHRGHVLVRDLRSGKEYKFDEPLPNLWQGVFSPRGDLLAIASEQGSVRFWQTARRSRTLARQTERTSDSVH
jgi:WD40 repeat protein